MKVLVCHAYMTPPPPSTQKNSTDYGKESFALTTRLLHVNPEFYTVWNYRRLILLNGIFPTRYACFFARAYVMNWPDVSKQ